MDEVFLKILVTPYACLNPKTVQKYVFKLGEQQSDAEPCSLEQIIKHHLCNEHPIK